MVSCRSAAGQLQTSKTALLQGLVGSQLRPWVGYLSSSSGLILVYVYGGPRVPGASWEQTLKQANNFWASFVSRIPVTKASDMVKLRFKGWSSPLGEKSYQVTLQRGLLTEMGKFVSILVLYIRIYAHYTYTFSSNKIWSIAYSFYFSPNTLWS